MKIHKAAQMKLKVAIYEKIGISRLVGFHENESNLKRRFVVLVGLDPLTEDAPGNFTMGVFTTLDFAYQSAKYYAEAKGYKLLLNRGLVRV